MIYRIAHLIFLATLTASHSAFAGTYRLHCLAPATIVPDQLITIADFAAYNPAEDLNKCASDISVRREITYFPQLINRLLFSETEFKKIGDSWQRHKVMNTTRTEATTATVATIGMGVAARLFSAVLAPMGNSQDAKLEMIPIDNKVSATTTVDVPVIATTIDASLGVIDAPAGMKHIISIEKLGPKLLAQLSENGKFTVCPYFLSSEKKFIYFTLNTEAPLQSIANSSAMTAGKTEREMFDRLRQVIFKALEQSKARATINIRLSKEEFDFLEAQLAKFRRSTLGHQPATLPLLLKDVSDPEEESSDGSREEETDSSGSTDLLEEEYYYVNESELPSKNSVPGRFTVENYQNISWLGENPPADATNIIEDGVRRINAILDPNQSYILASLSPEEHKNWVRSIVFAFWHKAFEMQSDFKEGSFVIIGAEDKIINFLMCENTSRNYYRRVSSHLKQTSDSFFHYGLDLDFPKDKGTILFFQYGLRDRSKATFIKPENYGTYKLDDIVEHFREWLHSVQVRSSGSKENDINPDYRKERVPVDLLNMYKNVVNTLPIDDTKKENFISDSKKFGIAAMAKHLASLADKAPYDQFLKELKGLGIPEANWHLEYRVGKEVIINLLPPQ